MPFDPSSGAVDVILAIAALATIVVLVRKWRPFWDDEFTLADRRLASQVAVFVVPPVVVLLHELGHLWAARALGVRVTDFRYGLFEGSVTIAGFRTPADEWLISIAGNLISVGAGLLLVVVALKGTGLRRPLRYVLLGAGLLELVFSLVGYPLLSLMARFGDWVVIYDFGLTPGLSWGAAVVHAAALFALWQWWRQKGRAALFTIGSGSEDEVAALQKAIDGSPKDPVAWLMLADYYARRGELALSRSTVEKGIDACGESPRLLLGLTRLSMYQRRWNDAVMAARRGLEASNGDLTVEAELEVRQPLWANLALALTQMERPEHALPAYGNLAPPLADDVRVRYGRGVVRMESGDVEAGRADLQTVVRELPEQSLLRKYAEARLEGRPVKDWEDPSVPSYARSTTPPPAPLAGL